MKVSHLLEAVKGAWKISNLLGISKSFKSEESPEARAWMRNRGDASQVWNAKGGWKKYARSMASFKG